MKKPGACAARFARVSPVSFPARLLCRRGASSLSVIIILFLLVVAAALYRLFFMPPVLAPENPAVSVPVDSKEAASPAPERLPAAGTGGGGHAPLAPPVEEIRPSEPALQPEKPSDRPPSVEPFRFTVSKGAAERRAESGMYSKEGGHFNVKYDGGENPVAGQLIGLLLEEAYIKVGADTGFYPSDKIEAVLYSKEQFRDVTRAPAWAGAIYDGRLKLPSGGITDRTELLEKVIFHEYTHAVVHRLSHGKAPTWLNEGLAQYEEGQDEALYKEDLKALALSNKVSLRRLEGSFMGMGGKSADAAYLLSLSATRYIIREYGVAGVRRIFEELALGKNLDAAIQGALYIPYEDLEKIWLNSLKK